LDLAPNTAFQDSSQFVKCNLSFTIPAEVCSDFTSNHCNIVFSSVFCAANTFPNVSQYPREQPIIRIQKAKVSLAETN
jgi:hypothetical protein